jgi:hypothetical protein
VGLIYGHVNEGIFAFLNWGISAGIPAIFGIPGIPRETCSTLMRSYKAVYIYTHMQLNTDDILYLTDLCTVIIHRDICPQNRFMDPLLTQHISPGMLYAGLLPPGKLSPR